MSKDSDIVFRRIRGRIVPIRKKRREDLKKGTALIATGTTISFGGAIAAGLTAKKFFKAQTKFENISANLAASRSSIPKFGQRDLFIKPRSKGRMGSAGKLAFKKSKRQFFKMRSYASITKGFFKGSGLASSALVGLGAEKLISASGYDKSTLGKEFGSEYLGFTAAAVNQAFASRTYRKFALNEPFIKGMKKDFTKGASATREALKTVSKFLIKRKLKL